LKEVSIVDWSVKSTDLVAVFNMTCQISFGYRLVTRSYFNT